MLFFFKKKKKNEEIYCEKCNKEIIVEKKAETLPYCPKCNIIKVSTNQVEKGLLSDLLLIKRPTKTN